MLSGHSVIKSLFRRFLFSFGLQLFVLFLLSFEINTLFTNVDKRISYFMVFIIHIEKQLQKNQYKVKCVPDNKYLKILIINDYNYEKLKKDIQDLYGINKNFIIISKVKQFTNLNSLKEMITLD